MYSPNKNNFIKILYISLYGNGKYIEDYNKWLDLFECFKNKNVTYILEYDSIKYPYIQKILEYFTINFCTSVFRIDDYNDIKSIQNGNCFISKCNFKIDADFCLNFKKGTLNSDLKVFYNTIREGNFSKIFNFEIDVFVNRNNIYCLYETLKMFSDLNISCNIVFYDSELSTKYNSKYCVDKYKVLNIDIGIQLMLEKILNDKNIKISNKDEIRFIIENGLDNICDIIKNFNVMYVNQNFEVCLCNKLNVTFEKNNPIDLLDNGTFKDEHCELIKQKCFEYCKGCSCLDFITS